MVSNSRCSNTDTSIQGDRSTRNAPNRLTAKIKSNVDLEGVAVVIEAQHPIVILTLPDRCTRLRSVPQLVQADLLLCATPVLLRETQNAGRSIARIVAEAAR